MSGENKRSDHEKNSHEYLDRAKYSHALNEESGLYEPTPKGQGYDVQRYGAGHVKENPLFVSSQKDWIDRTIASIAAIQGILQAIGIAISFGTLVLLCFTAFYTIRQWQEAHRSADAAILSAQAAETASDTAAATLREMKSGSKDTHSLVESARIQAETSQIAAQTAKDTLHISQGAYLTTGDPQFDFSAQTVRIAIINSGHIPAGKVVITNHEFTGSTSTPGDPKTTQVEAHWRTSTLPAVAVGSPFTFMAGIPKAIESEVIVGTQFVVIVGQLRYNDGFADTAERVWNFCYQTRYNLKSKKVEWIPCDASFMTNAIMKAEDYPKNEEK